MNEQESKDLDKLLKDFLKLVKKDKSLGEEVLKRNGFLDAKGNKTKEYVALCTA